MKSVLVIGMGRFGTHLAEKMQALGNDVMIVDKDEAKINALSETFADAHIGDCTSEVAIKGLGIKQMDICFVCVGEDFQASVVITSFLKRLGAKCIVAKASQDIQADLLLQIGANEVVYPEKEMAEKLAVRYNANNILDYIELTGEYSIYEIPVPITWTGKTLADLDVRKKYHINVVAVKNENNLNPSPTPEYIFRPMDHIILIGRSNDVFKLSGKKGK